MSVRGSKNKIILYVAGACSVLFIILLYHNATQRLEELEKSYERCHLNEESLSAQLQVNLEYKVRLEKSLQQEKSNHAQIKEDIQNKLEEERQARDKENLESNNKFSAMQQQYKFLQSQHKDLNLECSKLREMQLIQKEEKSKVENQLKSLNNELKLIRENKNNDMNLLKVKNNNLEKENNILKEENKKILNELNILKKNRLDESQIKLPRQQILNSFLNQSEKNENILQEPIIYQNIESLKSSTAANRQEIGHVPSAINIYVKTSTPMINPDAVLSQDKILSAAPVAQPQSGILSKVYVYNHKENVGSQHEDLPKQKPEIGNLNQGVLHAPDILNDFGHVPAINQYKEKLKQGFDKFENGEEVGDEKESLIKNDPQVHKSLWKVEEIENSPFARHSVRNEIPKNQLYNYQAEYDRRKEEGEDDDDVDPLDYHVNSNEKNPHQEEKVNLQGSNLKLSFDDKKDSVMIQPK